MSEQWLINKIIVQQVFLGVVYVRSLHRGCRILKHIACLQKANIETGRRPETFIAIELKHFSSSKLFFLLSEYVAYLLTRLNIRRCAVLNVKSHNRKANRK
jgi:hypothetical protein